MHLIEVSCCFKTGWDSGKIGLRPKERRLTNGNHRLQDKIIDLEVSNSTPSPTIDPSVRTILIGHSMGGIVAAETLISITDDPPVGNVPEPEH